MSLTLQDKFETIHAAELALGKAMADLVDPGTGESIAPGDEAVDGKTGTVWKNEAGKPKRDRKIKVVMPKAAS